MREMNLSPKVRMDQIHGSPRAVRNEIRKLQENPLLSEYRVHTALLRMGIEVNPATGCQIMAANRQLYGLEKPKSQPRARLDMPSKP